MVFGPSIGFTFAPDLSPRVIPQKSTYGHGRAYGKTAAAEHGVAPALDPEAWPIYADVS